MKKKKGKRRTEKTSRRKEIERDKRR